MLFSRVFISYMARELTKRMAAESCESRDTALLQRTVETAIVDELSLEDEINAEVRELLNQYTDYMRQQRIPYQEMFRKVKRNLLVERKIVSAHGGSPGERKMKISRDKVVELSHKIAAQLPRVSGLRMRKRWNEVRLDIVRELTNILMTEEAIDRRAQEKITSQQREIPEGSEEWTVLYRRYYDEELKRFGINLAAE